MKFFKSGSGNLLLAVEGGMQGPTSHLLTWHKVRPRLVLASQSNSNTNNRPNLIRPSTKLNMMIGLPW